MNVALERSPQYGWFPYPEKGETIFSLCSRAHVTLGLTSLTHSRSGGSLLRIASDVPGSLRDIQRVTAGVIAANEETIRSRTGLAPYLALMPSARRLRFVKLCLESGSSAARSNSGLGKYVGATRLLKLCRSCLAEQLEDNGTSWWSACHQLPAVWWCTSHRSQLAWVATTGRASTSALLPHMVEPEAESPSLSVEAQLKLLRIGDVVKWMGACWHLDTEILSVMFKERVRAAGLVRSELKQLAVELEHLQQTCSWHYKDVNVPDVQRTNGRAWLSALLQDTRMYDPIPWALGLAWCGSVRAADLGCEYIDAAGRKPQLDLFDPVLRTARRDRAPNRLYAAVSSGDSKDRIAVMYRLEMQELDSWLQKDPELNALWRQSRWDRSKEESVATINAFRRDRPGVSRIEIMRACSAAYRWLYINQPALLEKVVPASITSVVRQSSLPGFA
ncbi:MAG: hypothetical protein DI587_12565 [Variovorax paradoxus]|nr:MAG: hypothetical protein DI583_12565 [Variovorax paradoxus]PZQ10676.1 MAG: hypothetical protein DI587_12565 [Variovorax paradoxus]